MFLTKFFQLFYSKVFIGVDLNGDTCRLNILRIKGNAVKQNIQTEVKMADDLLPAEAVKLIDYYKQAFPYTYVGALSKTTNQGALPTTNYNDFMHYGLSYHNVDATAIDERWCCYIRKESVEDENRKFSEIGRLDYLFSPFVLLFLQAQQNIQEGRYLYALQERQSISVIITDLRYVYYGKFFEINTESHQNIQQPMLNSSAQTENNIEAIEGILDVLNQGFEDSFEELFGTDFEEMDLDEQADNFLEEKEHFDNIKDFMRTAIATEILEGVIKDYYSDPLSKFINKIVIMDTYGIKADSIKHMQDTLLLDIEVQPCDTAQLITSLMQKEIQK